MKRFIKFFSYTLILISIATFVSGCSNKKNTTTVKRPFVIWSFEDEDLWKPTISSIKKKLGNTEVVYVKKTFGPTYETEALNSMLSSQGPDIWAIPNDWVYRHKAKLSPMPDSLSKGLDLDEKFVPAIKESCVFENKIYSLSPYMDTLRVYYNSKLFQSELNSYLATNDIIRRSAEEKATYQKERARITNLLTAPPTTWTGITEAARLLTKKDGSSITQAGIALGTSNNISASPDILYAMMMQNGTKMTSDDLKIATFSLPEETSTEKTNAPAKRAVDYYTSFANPNSQNYSWNSSMPNDAEAFAQGKVAMILAYGNLQNYLRQNYPNFQYKTSVLPQIGDSQTNIIDYGAFNTLTVPITSIYGSVAWATVKDVALQSDIASSSHVTNALKKKDFTASLADRSNTSSSANNQNQTAHSWNKGRYPNEIDKIFSTIIDKTIAEPANSQAFIDAAALQATDLLKKTDW